MQPKIISKIDIRNYRAHSNLIINKIGNIQLFVGKNDTGKTCILKSLESLLNNIPLQQSDAHQANEDIKIAATFDSNVIKTSFDFKKNKYKKATNSSKLKYLYFGADYNASSEVKEISVCDLINRKRDISSVTHDMSKLKEDINQALDIFECIQKLNKHSELNHIIDEFLSERDVQILFAKQQEIYSYLSYSSCDRETCDKLYELIDGQSVINDISDIAYLCNDTTNSYLAKILSLGLSEEIRRIDSNKIKDERDSDFSEEIENIKQKTLKPLFNGTHEFSEVISDFLNYYNYYELFASEKNCDKIILCKDKINKNLNKYIKRKTDTKIVDKWEDLLSDFNTDEKIGCRGAGVQRLCALFDYTIDNYRNSKHDSIPICAIEEIEISLHPSQQRKLIKILKDISKSFQIIVTTHSPYVLSEFEDSFENIFVVKRNESGLTEVNPLTSRKLPYLSMAEINYIAFDEPSIEYHQELYGQIEVEYFGVSNGNKIGNMINSLWKNDGFTKMKQIIQDSRYSNPTLNTTNCNVDFDSPDKGRIQYFIPVAVRNAIDHPCEQNKQFKSIDTISVSIKILIKLWEDAEQIKIAFQNYAEEHLSELDNIGEHIVCTVDGQNDSSHTLAYWLDYIRRNNKDVMNDGKSIRNGIHYVRAMGIIKSAKLI